MNREPSQFEERQKQLQVIENRLRKREMLHTQNVQNWLNVAHACTNQKIYQSLIGRLLQVLEDDETDSSRKPDSFRPYCPEALSKSGALHILTQMDGVEIFIDPNVLVTGLAVIGPQGCGKTMFLVHLCEELLRVQP